MINAGTLSVIFFIAVILFFIFRDIRSYFKLRTGRYLITSVGGMLVILGLLTSYENHLLGNIVAATGYITFMIGLFIAVISEMGTKKREVGKKGMLYHPTFIITEIIVGILFIIWAIFQIVSNRTLSYDNIDSAIAIFFGIGFIIHAIIIKRKSGNYEK